MADGGRREPGEERLVDVDDVEAARRHGERDVGAGRDRKAGTAPPPALAQRHRGVIAT